MSAHFAPPRKTFAADHPAVIVQRPADQALPIVLDSPHSGSFYPEDFGHCAPFELVRMGEDLFVDALYEHAPSLGATLIAAQFPRAYIDPNRMLADLDADMLAGRWPDPVQPGPKTRLGIGLIWSKVGQVPMYDRKLGVAEVRQRIDRYWRPYHEALEQAIETAYDRFGGVWHMNVHSMPDDSYKWLGRTEKPLADFVLGNLDGRTCGPEVMRLIDNVIQDHGFSVARNEPFKGVEIIAVHGRPVENRHSLQIEIKRSCYADVDRYEPNDGFDKVQAALDAMLRALGEHSRRHA